MLLVPVLFLLSGCAPAPTASDVPFDDATAALGADDVQAAIDAGDRRLDDAETSQSSIESTLDSQGTTLDALSTAQGLLQGAVDTLSVTVDEHDEALTTLAGALEGLGTMLASLTAEDVGFDDTATGWGAVNVQTAIEALDASRLAAEDALAGAIASTDANVMGVQGSVDTLTGIVDGHTVDLANLSTSQAALSGVVDGLSGADVAYDDTASGWGVTDVQAAIEALHATTVAALAALETSMTTSLATVQGDLDALQVEVEAIDTELLSIGAEADSTAAELDALEADLACPSGMVEGGDVCIDASERASSPTGCSQFLEAIQDCAADGMHLCGSGEWLTACYASPEGLEEMSGNYEIVADLTSAGGFIVVGSAGCSNVGEEACDGDGNIGQALAYRCCR